ncbi:hypothetical protein [Isoalcanivorax beigongshangi]|uniref:Roadblock/LAMTOR2 domain-containing protein n=1 Tax=Isoalcanivorax beigongshangi TaxID=3238810 RepID=A0ABV4AIB4_9GAMM
MTSVNLELLNKVVTDSKNTLREGMLAMDIWERATGLSLAGHNSQPVAVALFTQVMEFLENTLEQSGFPALDRYFLMHMKDGHLVAIVNHGDLLQGYLLNDKINLGILLSVVIPGAIKDIAAAQA